jgi:hypothetical protein
MYSKIITITIALIALFSIGVYMAKEKPKNSSGINSIEEVVKPWIEVLNSPVLEIDSRYNERELHTGDELNENTTIKTGENAFANIYMSNGSVARIDSNTELILEKGSYDKKNGGMVVKIFLSAGRIWSKIFELSTPESLWEIKTTNAVATVRGTSFGMEYENKKSSVIGSENKVSVSAIDPKTNKIIENANVIIEPDKFIEISEEDILDVKKDGEKLKEKTKETPPDIYGKEWIKRSRTADTKLEEDRILLLEKGIRTNDMRRELFKRSNNDSPNEIPKNNDIPEPKAGSLILEKETVPVPVINKPKSDSLISEKEIVTIPIINKPKPDSLVLEVIGDAKNIIEDDIIEFRAILIMSDGSRKNVTNTVKWQILGQIGNITVSGIFTAKLDISISELGEGFGTVIATWENPNDTNIFLGKSPILNVKAKFEKTTDFRG